MADFGPDPEWSGPGPFYQRQNPDRLTRHPDPFQEIIPDPFDRKHLTMLGAFELPSEVKRNSIGMLFLH
jgi:hypothetical protein